MNIRKGLNKTYSLLMVATGDKFALIYATDVVMQLMFGSGIRVAYNVLRLCVSAVIELLMLNLKLK